VNQRLEGSFEPLAAAAQMMQDHPTGEDERSPVNAGKFRAGLGV